MQLSGDERKTKVFAVFNSCSEATIPLENFVNIDAGRFEKHVVSFCQDQEKLHGLTAREYHHDNSLILHGLHSKGFLPFNILKLAGLLLKEKPDIIHVHHSFSGLASTVIGRLFSKTRIVVTLHSDYGFYNRAQKLCFLLMCMAADLVVCNSNNTKRSLDGIRERFFRKVEMVVIYNGVNLEKVRRACRPGVAGAGREGVFVVGSVGRLSCAKDHETMIRAFASFSRKIDSELRLVGDGPLRRKLETLSEKLGIREKVFFYGSLPRARAYEELCAFDIFVVSSRWEGFCNAIAEAMIGQIEVIASRIETLVEVVGEDNGTFFTVGDAEDLCRKMLACYEHRSRHDDMIRRSHDFACMRYSLEQSSRRYAHAYETALGRPVWSSNSSVV
ncbi:MAG: glycosyltransferase [Thermodesulfobacteriota bacterium]